MLRRWRAKSDDRQQFPKILPHDVAGHFSNARKEAVPASRSQCWWLALRGARSHAVQAYDAKAKAGPVHAFCIQLLLFFQRRSRSSTRAMPTVRHVIGRCSESRSASAPKQECSRRPKSGPAISPSTAAPISKVAHSRRKTKTSERTALLPPSPPRAGGAIVGRVHGRTDVSRTAKICRSNICYPL